MKVTTHIETKEVEVRTYIAEDGKKFATEYKCREYEKNNLQNEKYKKVLALRMDNAGDLTPCDGSCVCEDRYYYWYNIENEEQLKVINDFYEFNNSSDLKVNFPEIICIETDSEEDNFGWFTKLSDVTCYVKHFYELLGYEVSLKKISV